MSSSLVVKASDVIENFRTLIKYRNSKSHSEQDYYTGLIRRGKVFVIEIINGNIELAPSKFVGYKNNSMQEHERYKSNGRSGTETTPQLTRIYQLHNKVIIDPQIDAVMDVFKNKHSITLSSRNRKAKYKYIFNPSERNKILSFNNPQIPFFTKTDIQKYTEYARKDYGKNNPGSIEIGENIREKFFDATNYWAQSINIPGFIAKPGTQWQIMGKFLSYTWARIVRSEYADYGVYFTIGLDYDAKALIYKIDYQRKESKKCKVLTQEQSRIFEELIDGTGAEWQQIDLGKIGSYNWEKLIIETEEFIHNYTHLYDTLIARIFGIPEISPQQQYEFVKKGAEFVHNKQVNPKNIRKSKRDWVSHNREMAQLGRAGEEFIVMVEKKELEKKGLNNLAERVEHTAKEKGDGFGYDITSFTPDNKVKYIEVKTTAGGCESPIYLSINEIRVSKELGSSFYLYRVYNFDKLGKSGKILVKRGPLDEKEFKVEGYSAIVTSKK